MGHGVKGNEHSIGTLTHIIIVCVLVVGPLGWCGRPMISLSHQLASEGSAPGSTQFQTLLMADNQAGSQKEPISNSGQPQPASGDRQDSQPNSEPDPEIKKRPLKPFKPSERIKADQAVDFPSDI